MAPLIGFTLGERHKYYNQLVKEAIANKTTSLLRINFEEDDVENMIRIDIACYEQNVDYVMEIFKTEDMLYVTRAINKSTWLITNPKYAHLINPKYLHSELFPYMNTKAVTKLMLHIRRHLKDEVRVKAFFRYVDTKCQEKSLHWLNNCSVKFIETIVAARADKLPVKLLKRLCRKSINILRVWAQNQKYYNYNICDVYAQTKYFLKRNKMAEEYLDIIDHHPDLARKNYNSKYTNILMRQCPARINDNFHQYHVNIDLTTFANLLKAKGEDISNFLIKNNAHVKSFEILAPFLANLPREEMFNFLKELYEINLQNPDIKDFEALFYAIEGKEYRRFSDIYRWYQFAPFDVAFRDIKKFIFAEFSPAERHSMLNVLLLCASCNLEHVKTILKYYHDNHINEPYLHKITFVNSLLAQHNAFRFDDITWNTLNRLFHSLEVYIESGNEVQMCLISIILHNVVRDQPVHAIVEDKFHIQTLIGAKVILNAPEQEKLFNYLYKISFEKLCKQNTNSETGMHKAIKLLENLWNLLQDWNKVEIYHNVVIDKIAKFGAIAKSSSWISEIQKARRKRRRRRPNRDYKVRPRIVNAEPFVNIPSIYKMVKSYRKLLFDNSLALHPSEEVCLNALKHDPGLLTRFKNEIDELRCNDEISLRRFLSKLRVYWPDTLALEWKDTNFGYITKCTGHRALVRGIIALLPHKDLLDYVRSNKPIDTKIHWSEVNETELSVQKHIAKHMHIARPQLPAEVVLWYAKGDYLQYALLSLNTMYYNLRSNDIEKYISIMLDAPVSLQKHGIRLAFCKYKRDEILKASKKVWNNTRNSSLRAVVFTSLFKLLCKEKKVMAIKSIWSVLDSLMDELHQNENKAIYLVFRTISAVPVAVIGECFQKIYLFLKTMPSKSDLDHILELVNDYASNSMMYLDNDFVENTLLSSVYDDIFNRDSSQIKTLSAYLLYSKDSTIQTQKYNKTLKPVIDKCFPNWVEGGKDLLDGFQDLLSCICSKIPLYVVENKMVMPVEMVGNVFYAFYRSLCIKEHYTFLRRWLLTSQYLYNLEYKIMTFEALSEPYTWEILRTKTTRALATVSANLLAKDHNESFVFTTVYLVFEDAFRQVLKDFEVKDIDLLRVLYKMLEWKLHPSVYLLVLRMLPQYGWGDEYTNRMEAIKREIYFYKTDEVKLQYFQRFSDKYSEADEPEYDNESDDEDFNDCVSETSLSPLDIEGQEDCYTVDCPCKVHKKI